MISELARRLVEELHEVWDVHERQAIARRYFDRVAFLARHGGDGGSFCDDLTCRSCVAMAYAQGRGRPGTPCAIVVEELRAWNGRGCRCEKPVMGAAVLQPAVDSAVGLEGASPYPRIASAAPVSIPEAPPPPAVTAWPRTTAAQPGTYYLSPPTPEADATGVP